MKILHTVTGVLPVNTYYLVNTETNEAIVIDGGMKAEKVLSFAKANGFTVKYMLLTHTHFDHGACAAELQDNGVKILVSKEEEEGLRNPLFNLSTDFRVAYPPLYADKTFSDNEELTLCGINIKVLLTPGHSVGSASFIVEDNIFSGDTLFLESVGRYDLYGSDGQKERQSVKRLLSLDGDYTVYPGHGDTTTLSHERVYNPFI